MFTILTRPISGIHAYKYFLKEGLKKIFFARTYGPSSVIESIVKGLSELPEVEYNLNPRQLKIANTVYVPIGIDTLRYALDLKKKGKIKKLVVGPNITVPTSKDDIFFHPLIDTIVVPSDWVKDYFISLGLDHKERIVVVPAGVDIFPTSIKNSAILIYKKDCPDSLFENIKSVLASQKIPYEIIEYGKFKKTEYLKYLSHTEGLIYLQASESQGIALHEAWMHDVPTLVWNRGYWEYGGKIWKDQKISAPYLIDDCGIFFNEENFSLRLSLFLENLSVYSPRKYSIQNFSNTITTKNLLQYLQ